MGPNRQRKPREQNSKLHQRRRNFVQNHNKPKSDRDPVGSLSKEAKDVVVDVLKHVAGAAEIPENFDPSQSSGNQNVIVFKKNQAMTPHQNLQLIFERLGFPPDVVAEYLNEVMLKPETPKLHSVGAYMSSETAVEWIQSAAWDLFPMMVWNSPDGAAAAEAQQQEDDDGDAADEDELDEILEQEIDGAKMIFEEELLGVTDPDSIPDTEEYEAELTFQLRTKDDVIVHLIIRLPGFYPKDPPLIRIELPPAGTKNQKTAPNGKRLTLTPQVRREVMDTAVSTICTMMGTPILIPLVGACKDIISSVDGIVAVAGSSSLSEKEEAKKREEALKAKKEEESKRSKFVDALASNVGVVKKPETSKLSAKEKEEAEWKALEQEKMRREEQADADEQQLKLPEKVALATVGGDDVGDDAGESQYGTAKRKHFLKRDAKADETMANEWENLRATNPLQKVRDNLPAYDVREELRKVINDNQVVVIGGETGSGKTTQVPQFLLEYGIESGNGSTTNIVCTQPRRLAATAVAIRVAEERGEEIGGTVGYSIRLENKVSAKTKLLYCTTGIILRRLQSDHYLGNVSHIVVDEIHERGVDTDFLLILLRDLMQKRKDIKIILMSATMNSELFSKYFYGAPVVAIKGRTHPVEVFHLENVVKMIDYKIEEGGQYAKSVFQKRRRNVRTQHMTSLDFGKADAEVEAQQREEEAAIAKGGGDLAETASTLALMDPEQINYELIEQLVDYIDQTYKFEGAILIFLPGLAEIQKCCDELKSNTRLASKCVIHNLHSSLGSSTQQAVFGRPPKGKRKVVIGTNIMETSITIDDAVFVIDAGKFKENRYDAKKSLSSLVMCTIARANAGQRSGRAGRVRPGFCFRLYTSVQYQQMEPHQLCEMHRVPLESLVLQIYMLRLGDEFSFLQKALSPPEERAVKASVKVLQNLGALTHEKRLTSLGYHLANLPLDVKIGKMIIHGALLKCVDPVLTIAACLSIKPPFQTSTEDQAQINATKRAFARGTKSDQLSSWYAYASWISKVHTSEGTERQKQAIVKQYCADAWLSASALSQIQSTKKQYERYLVEAGFIEDTDAFGKAKKQRMKFLFDPYITLDDSVYESGGQRNNSNSGNHKCILACLLAGLYPNCAKISRPNPKKPKMIKMSSLTGDEVTIHPSSVNGATDAAENFGYPLLLYVDNVKTNALYIRDVSVISPLMMVLFGGPVRYLSDYGEIVVDDMVGLRTSEEDAVLLLTLREQLDSVLKTKINDPNTSWESASLNVVKVIVRLLKEEGTGSHAMVVVDQKERKSLTAPLIQPKGPAKEGGTESGSPKAPAVKYSAKKCFQCGEFGHLSQHCPRPAPKEKGAARVKCFICGEWHHPFDCTLCRSTK